MKKFLLFLIIITFGFKSDEYRPVHIFMIGDSTMANKSEKSLPEYGWGQVLQDFFNDSVVVDNHAKNGRSSKSFIDESRWDSVIVKVKKGDYVIIQFGHNDKKKKSPKRYTEPFTTYTENLERFIKETTDKGGIPVLCTPIVRRHFDQNDSLINTHGDYLVAVKKVVKETGVYFLDMEAKTRELVTKMGPEKSKQLFMFCEPGIFPNRFKGVQDSTHLTQFGAYTVASLAVKEMKKNNIPVTRYLKNK